MGARAPGHHRAGSIRRTIRSLPDPVTRSLGSLALGSVRSELVGKGCVPAARLRTLRGRPRRCHRLCFSRVAGLGNRPYAAVLARKQRRDR
jgi:hypothetical protein